MKRYALIALLLFTAPLFAQQQAPRPKQAPEPKQGPPMAAEPIQAPKTGVVDRGDGKKSIMFQGYWYAFDANYWSDEDILEWAQRGGPIQTETFFRKLPRARPDAAGDAGSFPAEMSFLNNMERYDRARRTQISFRRFSGYIGSEPRSRLEMKWQVPGGLEGVSGWTSKLYRNAQSQIFLERQNPGEFGSAITWQRSYQDGSIFADVLTSRGTVFEVRVAEKQNGQWQRYVAYHDADAAPRGYTRLKSSQCIECHSQAGVAAYAGAAIPGGDTVISDPIPIVERGQNVQGGNGLRL